MSYSSGMLSERVKVLVLQPDGYSYTSGKTIWASVTWTKGARAMMQGEITAYESIMIRCRYDSAINRTCRLMWNCKQYVIDSINESRRENTIQIVCTETSPVDVE